MNPYHSFVSKFARLKEEGLKLPLGALPPAPRPELPPTAPHVLIFAPHPDDECIIGGLPLRLLREAKMKIVNVAVTLGSKKERRQERLRELRGACEFLGFDLVPAKPDGLEAISTKTRKGRPAEWLKAVDIVAGLLRQHQPKAIFLPHENDWNSTHIGTHCLVADALFSAGESFNCWIVQTEFWGQMSNPNLMIESSEADVADLVAATSFHTGEVKRNPYHLLLPAWLQDNVRRGGELVGGQGAAAPNFTFATLYRVCRWKNRRFEDAFSGGKTISVRDNPAALFSE